jgi:DNA-binding response OmpR family regulator
LVVDDQPEMQLLLSLSLRRAGYTVATAANGPAALAEFIERRPDAVLLDVLMPGMDGYELCRRLRDLADVPVIMVSALRNEAEIVRGLDAGADDYVTKPFGITELLARLRAQTRRVRRVEAVPSCLVFRGGRFQLDLDARRVVIDGQEVRLGPTEFRLLGYLAANAGRVVPHQELLEQVWGPESAHLGRYVRIYVQRLRRKIESDDAGGPYIVSAHGVGYGFRAEAGDAGDAGVSRDPAA